MSNLPTTLSPNDDTLELNDVELRTPTLITEQQVRFSTAAALLAPTRQRKRGAGVFAAIRRMFVAPSEAPRPKRRYVARRYTYLENALMAREMHRL
jgi:hypothetical protein